MNSKHKSDYGEWKLTAGSFYGDAEKDKGIYYYIIIVIKQELCALIKNNNSLVLIVLYSLWLKSCVSLLMLTFTQYLNGGNNPWIFWE